jgi:hypothetical protein
MKTLHVCVVHLKTHGCTEGKRFRQCEKDCGQLCDYSGDTAEAFDFYKTPCPFYCPGRKENAKTLYKPQPAVDAEPRVAQVQTPGRESYFPYEEIDLSV